MGHISSPPFPVGPPRGASSWTATVWYSRNHVPVPWKPLSRSLWPQPVVSETCCFQAGQCCRVIMFRTRMLPRGLKAIWWACRILQLLVSLLSVSPFCLLCHFLMRIRFRRVCEYSMFAHFTMKFHAVNETSDDLPSAVRFLKIFMEWVYFVFSTIRTEPTTSYLFCLIFASLFLTKNMQFL